MIKNFSHLSHSIIANECNPRIRNAIVNFLNEVTPSHTLTSKKFNLWDLFGKHLDLPFEELMNEWQMGSLPMSLSAFAKKSEKNKNWLAKHLEITRIFKELATIQPTGILNQSSLEFDGTSYTLQSLMNFCYNRRSITKPKYREFCMLCHEVTEIIENSKMTSEFCLNGTTLSWRKSYSIDKISIADLNLNANANKKFCSKHNPRSPSYFSDINGIYYNNQNIFDELAHSVGQLFATKRWPVPHERVSRILTYDFIHSTNSKQIITNERNSLYHARVLREAFFKEFLSENLINWEKYFSKNSEYEIFTLNITPSLIRMEFIQKENNIDEYKDLQSKSTKINLDREFKSECLQERIANPNSLYEFDFGFEALQNKVKSIINAQDNFELYIPKLDMTIFLNPHGYPQEITVILGSAYYLNDTIRETLKNDLKKKRDEIVYSYKNI